MARVAIWVLCGVSFYSQAAFGQPLPPPPAVPNSLDTVHLLSPSSGANPKSSPNRKLPVIPLNDALANPVPLPDAPKAEIPLNVEVGRQITFEKETPNPNSEGGLAEDLVPVVLQERSTGRQFTIIPGQGIRIEEPQSPQSARTAPAPPEDNPGGSVGSEKLLYPLPAPVPLTSGFGWRLDPISGQQEFHQGIDLAASLGTPVLAAYSGRVLLAGPAGGLGNAVFLNHTSTLRTRYGHLSKVAVIPGQLVRQGSVIGYVGSTGDSTGPHLHFEVWKRQPGQDWVAIDAASQLKVALAQLNKRNP